MSAQLNYSTVHQYFTNLLKPLIQYDVTKTSWERRRHFDLAHETFNRDKDIDEIHD